MTAHHLAAQAIAMREAALGTVLVIVNMISRWDFPGGAASDQCLLISVSEARMRELQVLVRADCAASQTPARHRTLTAQLREVWNVRTPASRAFRLRR